jgi:hypothetical protein
MRAPLIWALLVATACSKAGEPMDKPCGGPADCTNPAEP